LLRENDFPIYSISESDFGINDTNVLAVAIEKKSFLITEDKDFGALAIHEKLPHKGILLIRRKSTSAVEQCEIVLNLLQMRSKELSNHFSVLRDRRLIIRG
jgi:predicted nuclease of predicted toxin-antitoxin system